MTTYIVAQSISFHRAPGREVVLAILQRHLPRPITSTAKLRIQHDPLTGEWDANLIDAVGEQSITFFSNGSMAVYVGKII